jgi:hypothetical protein
LRCINCWAPQRTEFMPSQDQKLCERCHEHPVTFFICDGNTGESKSLCEQCYRKSASPEELASSDSFRDIVRNGKCKHCGAPAETGLGNFDSVEGGHFDLSCKTCDKDLADFNRRPENVVPPVRDYGAMFRDEEFMRQRLKQFADIKQRQEEFIRQRILERRAKGDA